MGEYCEKCGSVLTAPAKVVNGKSLCIWCAKRCLPDDSYQTSHKLRKEIKKAHNLVFHQKRTCDDIDRSKSVSIVSMQVNKLRDCEYDLLVHKLNLLPEKKRVQFDRKSSKIVKNVLGDELAYALIELIPDTKRIAELSKFIPDVDKRISY